MHGTVVVMVIASFFLFFYSITFEGEDGNIFLDYSKNIVTKDTMKLLFALVCMCVQYCVYVCVYVYVCVCVCVCVCVNVLLGYLINSLYIP